MTVTILTGLSRPTATTGATPLRLLRRGLAGPLRYIGRFYARPEQVRALLITSGLLSYLGGAVMFWFHGIYRGEQGPPISPPAHWLLDSTLGFIALTPALAVLLPLATWTVLHIRTRPTPGALARLIGPSFALVTAPGPAVHNLLVGRGTALANIATDLIGPDTTTAQALTGQQPAAIECLLQVLIGLPVYTAVIWVALTVLNLTNRGTALGSAGPRPPWPPCATPAAPGSSSWVTQV